MATIDENLDENELFLDKSSYGFNGEEYSGGGFVFVPPKGYLDPKEGIIRKVISYLVEKKENFYRIVGWS